MDTEARRRALSRLTAGVYVLTARDGDRFGAATVAWAMQTSFKPLLFTVALGRNSNVFRCLAQSCAATLHVAGHGQLELARRFACPTEAGDGRINGESYVDGVTSAPVLGVFPAHFECLVDEIHDSAGDHALVVLRAVAVKCRTRFRPMMLGALRKYLESAPLPPRREADRSAPASTPGGVASEHPANERPQPPPGV
jgi:flavin reductase (DIM6/NTAB) family NADH-FMN oxidoreductase RutF